MHNLRKFIHLYKDKDLATGFPRARQPAEFKFFEAGRPTAFLSPGHAANSREIDPALRRNRAPISVGPRPSSACHKRANLCSSTDMRGGCGWATLGRRATIGALWVERMDWNCVGITSPQKLRNSKLGPHDRDGRGTCDHLARVHPT